MEIAIGLGDRESTPVSRVPWREAATVFKVMGFVLLASTGYIFAQIPPTTEAEKWMGPVFLGLTNLLGSIFAFLTAREMRMHDVEKKTMKADFDRKCKDYDDCHTERTELRGKVLKNERKIQRLERRLGMEESEDEERAAGDEYIERRGEPDPSYRGPKRRKEDKPKTDPPKPPLPPEPK